ncbi:MAG: phage tail tape measure protein [Clostridiales bacterium]|nr:phage tail tape measure protein [Clostridiales bacterium]
MASLSVIFKAVDELSSKMDAMANAGSKVMDKFDQIGDIADEAFSGIAQGTDEAAEALDQAADSTDFWTDKIGNYNKEAMQAIYTIEELVEQGYMTEDALKAAADSTEEFGEEVDDAGKKSEEFGKKSEDAVSGLNDLLATAGIVAALKAITSAFQESSEAAAEFETNVAKVSTVADTTVLSADELSSQITDLSKETATSVNEIADATYNAISAGVDTANAVDTVRIATQLATSGFTDTTSALSVLTTIMNAYGMSADELTNVSDSLIQTQNNGVTTIDQLASSMGKAISTASAYSIDLYNLEAAYISTTKAGISTEESTTYLASMFKELGTSGTEVADVLLEQTGKSFGQLMQDGYSLGDVLEMLYSSVNYDAEALMNLWSSAEAGKAANAVISQGLDTFNENLVALGNSAGTTEAAYATMTDTSTYATERLQNSMSNLSIAIGDDVNPAVNMFKNGLADVADVLTELIEDNPAITSFLTGFVVTIGAVTAAVTAYTAVTKLAAAASTLLGTSITAALGPLALVAAAIGAVAAVVTVLKNDYDETYDEVQSMTAVTAQQTEELEELEEQYEEACRVYGETSDEASSLKYQIDDLSDSIAANGQSVEELVSEVDELISAHDELMNSYADTVESINNEQIENLALVAKLNDLASATDQTSGSQAAMQSIIDELNGSIDGLNLTYEDLVSNQESSIESIRAMAEAQAEQEKQQEAYAEYVALIKQAAEEQEELSKVTDEVTAAQERADAAYSTYYDTIIGSNWKAIYTSWGVGDIAATKNATQDALEEVTASQEELQEALDETQARIAEIEAEWGDLSDAAQDSAETATDGYEEAQAVLENYSAEIQELCEAYDEAYESALSSIQGQYSLWDEVEDIASMSSKNITDALQSQIDYWNSYNENMDSLTERASEIEGLSDMLAELADGSEDSAAMLAGMSEMNDADLSAVVQQYNDLQEAQSETASSVADLQTEFSEKLDEMQTEMDSMVDSMDMSEEAKANAKSTMDAYVSEIQSGVEKAQSAIDSLSFANTTLSTGGYKGYATGTVDAEPGLALVGEEGPELVNFGGGEVVYTADETANILSRDGVKDDLYVEPSESDEGNEGGGDKTITLKIEGGGSLNVGSGVTKEDVWDMMVGNLKEVFMNIVQQEIMEEGDLSYEF